MRYLLAVLSHGDPSDTAEDCIDSFMQHVTPTPTAGLWHHDGPGTAHAPMDALGGLPWVVRAGGDQRGFCAATAQHWGEASRAALLVECPYVFWLEHDFVFTRTVDLADLAYVLNVRRDLAQMALMRDGVNPDERAAGGLYEHRRDDYRAMVTYVGLSGVEYDWLHHSAYFTTNPSLIPTQFMRDHPFPADPPECEGRFGIRLADEGYRFGAWGDGSPWVSHVGVRTGVGY